MCNISQGSLTIRLPMFLEQYVFLSYSILRETVWEMLIYHFTFLMQLYLLFKLPCYTDIEERILLNEV